MTTKPFHSNEPVHTFGCAFAQRGAQCDCAEPFGERCYVFAAEMSRAMSRGFDYSLLVEGLHDDEGES